jgi:hypothetical protein
VRQPQRWCDPAGESPAQVKGSVLLGSECCVATGDSGCEAYLGECQFAVRTRVTSRPPQSKVYRDHGISGAKGQDKRPQFDALCSGAP